jgi:hypothetical protein
MRRADCYIPDFVARSIARFLVLIAAVQLLGGHWAVLQTVAWVGMAIEYAQTDSISGALAKTFDGAHPCELCQVVTKGQAKEKTQDQVRLVVKLDAILAPAVALPPRPEAPARFFVQTSLRGRHSAAPPTRPPIG